MSEQEITNRIYNLAADFNALVRQATRMGLTVRAEIDRLALSGMEGGRAEVITLEVLVSKLLAPSQPNRP